MPVRSLDQSSGGPVGTAAAVRHAPDPSARLARWLVLFVVLVCGLLVGIEVWHEHNQRVADISDAEVAAANLARSLAQHADDSVEMGGTALVAISDRIRADGLGPDALRRLRTLLLIQTSELPRVDGLFVYDADGNWLVSSAPDEAKRFNNSDREYFQHHRQSGSTELYIGRPVRSRTSGQWIVPVSRRIDGPDGAFAGVVLATIAVDYFSGFYSSFDVGRTGSIALFRTDGIVLARFPYEERFIGRDLSRSPLFSQQLPARNSGTYRMTSPLDGVDRIAAFQRGRNGMLGAVVALSVDDVLAGWRSNVINRGAVVLLLVLLMAGLGAILLRQLGREQKIRSALVESETNFRLLAENSSDVVSRVGRDGRRRYVSPAASRVFGQTPEQLVGSSVFNLVDPEDRPAFDQAVHQLRSGEKDAVTVTHRMRRPDGTLVWLESSVHVARDSVTGQRDGVVSVSRDITERKALEAELASLARTDGLTGLANRREFNERLLASWRSAVREATPLSLILLDLDRFKIFNDTYGHQAGDECLQAVAVELKRNARRPFDLAARYGGEELALLLPGTDAAGAYIVAERVRDDVAQLGIRHDGNEPFGVVTVSVGVATLEDGGGLSTSSTMLVAAADGALYSAKRTGRNRVAGEARVPAGGQEQAA